MNSFVLKYKYTNDERLAKGLKNCLGYDPRYVIVCLSFKDKFYERYMWRECIEELLEFINDLNEAEFDNYKETQVELKNLLDKVVNPMVDLEESEVYHSLLSEEEKTDLKRRVEAERKEYTSGPWWSREYY